MGNVEGGFYNQQSSNLVNNFLTTINQLIVQLNTLHTTMNLPGPLTQFVSNTRSIIASIKQDIETLKANEPSSVNLSTINNSIASLNASVQQTMNDIIVLQNQLVNIPQMQFIQEALSTITNSLTTVVSQLGNVNVTTLQSTVDSIVTVITNLTNSVANKVDKITTVNGKYLSSNITITKSDIGLSNVTNDLQLKRAANDFASFSILSTASADDLILLEDVNLGGNKFASRLSNLPLSNKAVLELSGKVDNIDLQPVNLGATNKTLTLNINEQGQVILASEGLINITPTQANLGNVVNSDTTNVANSYVRNSFLPINSTIIVGDSCLNSLQKLQGQINARTSPMVGATSITNGSEGVVPVPLAGKNNSFLRGDGTWAKPMKNVVFQTVSLNPAVVDTIYFVDTTVSSFSITLPLNPAQGSLITFVDVNNTLSTNALILAATAPNTINQTVIRSNITNAYFSSGKWVVDNQKQTISSPIVNSSLVLPAPTILNNTSVTLGNVANVLLGNSQWHDIVVNHSFTAVAPINPYVLLLNVILVDNITNAVLKEIKKSITVSPSLTNALFEETVSYRLYPTVDTRIRIDAKINNGSNILDTEYDYAFTAEINSSII